MKHLVLKFLRDETGTAAIEYGIIAALISVPTWSAAKPWRWRSATPSIKSPMP
jgi:hypothetical protein